jgi:hypothetical protein
MNKIEDVCEMICLAYHEDYKSKSDSEKEGIRRWAASIVKYLGVRT